MKPKRFAVEIKWDSRKTRYVARIKDCPSVVAYGSTIPEAQENVNRELRRQLFGEEKANG